MGIIKDGEFSDKEYKCKITRKEMTRMIVRRPKEDTMIGKTNFSDDSLIDSGMKGYVKKAVDLGIIDGYPDGTFKPQGKAMRAEASKLIFMLTEFMDGTEDFEEVFIEEELEKENLLKKNL